jgi:hypothetical protein
MRIDDPAVTNAGRGERVVHALHVATQHFWRQVQARGKIATRDKQGQNGKT